MRLTLEETLQEVERYVARRFSDAFNLEDLIQEGRISAWKDYESGKEPKHIRMRAKYRVMGLLRVGTPNSQMKGGAHPQQWTGHLTSGRGHQDHADGQPSREKIKQFLSEYRDLHGHEPTQDEIAQAVGLTKASVINQLKRLYLFSGPYLESVTSFEAMPGFDCPDNTDVESPVCNRLDTLRLLREHVPNDKHRAWLYLNVYEDLTHREIAERYGVSTPAVSQALRRVLRDLKEVVIR